VAGGLVGADEWPPVVHVASVGSVWSSLVKVGADGWRKDVLTAGDANPYHIEARMRFFSPVDAGLARPSTCVAVGSLAKVAGQLVPFLMGDRPVSEPGSTDLLPMNCPE
jgi:hypothetical protein